MASVFRGTYSQCTVPLGILPRPLGPGGFWSDLREVTPGQSREGQEAPKAWIIFIPNANSLHSPGAAWPASAAQSARCFAPHQPVRKGLLLGERRLRGWCQVGHSGRWETLERGQSCHNNQPGPTALHTHALQPHGFCARLSFAGTEEKGEEEPLVSMAFPGLTQIALLLLTLPLSHPESSWKAGPLG